MIQAFRSNMVLNSNSLATGVVQPPRYRSLIQPLTQVHAAEFLPSNIVPIRQGFQLFIRCLHIFIMVLLSLFSFCVCNDLRKKQGL